MRQSTLCYLLTNTNILLGRKMRGVGQGKLNGYGGKLEPGETPEEAILRELFEESGVRAKADELQKVAELELVYLDRPEWNTLCHAYVLFSWEGEPRETDEMSPVWCSREHIPYHDMWIDDRHWMPLVLSGKKIRGKYVFTEAGTALEVFESREVQTF